MVYDAYGQNKPTIWYFGFEKGEKHTVGGKNNF